LLAGRRVRVEKTRVVGCSTKWADKRDSAAKELEKWNAEPVEMTVLDEAGLKELAANQTEKFRLVNLWGTTCIPCIAELPDYVTLNRMYRGRHFEMYTLSTDPPERRELALEFLKKAHVSSTNYVFHSEDLDSLAAALDPEWEGPLPYTILIAPGGEIVKRWKEAADLQELKTEISNRLGRTYADRK
jgi:hypothetical protein